MTAVVGLDLSLTATGIATPGGVRTVGSRGKTGATLRQRSARLHDLAMDIGGEIDRVANEHRPSTRDRLLVVVEAPAFSRTTGHQHDRSGLWWLVVDELCGSSYATVVEVAPSARAKYATGKGNAGKDEVLAAVVRRYPDVDVSNNNEADSLVLRAMGCRAIGHPLEESLPQTHLAALDKVRWPELVTTC